MRLAAMRQTHSPASPRLTSGSVKNSVKSREPDRPAASCPSTPTQKEFEMYGIFYLIGLIVVVLAVLNLIT